jgi:anti-sigma regulatory factor (Ser/Thr protein kinase)
MKPLTVSGTLDSLDHIAEYIAHAARIAGLDKKASYKLRLAVDEIATNIIVHGYQNTEQSGTLDLHAELDPDRLTVFLEDTSVDFDPLEKVELEASTIHQPVEARPIGGLGIYLAVRGVDKFIHERIGNRNRNIFIVNRSSLAP